jgi:hypothetical protein
MKTLSRRAQRERVPPKAAGEGFRPPPLTRSLRGHPVPGAGEAVAAVGDRGYNPLSRWERVCAVRAG